MKNIHLMNREYKDFVPLVIGNQKCGPNHRVRPYKINEYMIHFVIDGEGVFVKPHNTYNVKKGHAFLIRPGEFCGYYPDKQNPWHYMWIHFDGLQAKQFDKFPDVFPVEEEFILDLYKCFEMDKNAQEYVTGMLFILYSKLLVSKSKDDYASKVKAYIDLKYASDISIQSIADELAITRKHLNRLFKSRYNVTIQQYLVGKRLDCAKRFLEYGYGVEQSAYMSGYRDSFNFSRAFKKHFGISPNEYKKLKK